jgi:hypothetical protein
LSGVVVGRRVDLEDTEAEEGGREASNAVVSLLYAWEARIAFFFFLKPEGYAAESGQSLGEQKVAPLGLKGAAFNLGVNTFVVFGYDRK